MEVDQTYVPRLKINSSPFSNGKRLPLGEHETLKAASQSEQIPDRKNSTYFSTRVELWSIVAITWPYAVPSPSNVFCQSEIPNLLHKLLREIYATS